MTRTGGRGNRNSPADGVFGQQTLARAGDSRDNDICAVQHKNVSLARVVSEESLLVGISRYRKKAVLAHWRAQVRLGRYRREVIDGIPFFIAVTQEART